MEIRKGIKFFKKIIERKRVNTYLGVSLKLKCPISKLVS
jgi:hypothetical protein